MQKAMEFRRQDSRIIIHFDYDCFYASVVENANPALKSVPLAIQQKQIIVTCNYEARRRGLRKLQLVTEARRACPDVVIVLGEDIAPFRNASKDLYNFLRSKIWSDRAERLGFDEVWLDCTDMVDYNMGLINFHNLTESFFCMDKEDPTVGFAYDASSVSGPTYPKNGQVLPMEALEKDQQTTFTRLCVASHLALHLRRELEFHKGYTATVGIATNKIISKLVGNANKPNNQTTIMPPYGPVGSPIATITRFMDSHDIGKVPGVGFKLATQIRAKVLGKSSIIHDGPSYGIPKESITVEDVRLFPGMGPELLEQILGGPGSQKGIGGKVWEFLNGIDDSEVGKARRVPSQISQEDSYNKYLHTFDQVKKQLILLAERLIHRMHIDLMEDDEDDGPGSLPTRRWLAHPKTLRLTTRPQPPPGADGVRARSFHRISRSGPIPNFVFGLNETSSCLAEKLVDECLVSMFRKLHPEQHGWRLSLVNIAVTNMAETAAESKDSDGRDIGRMFKRQDEFLKDFKVTDFSNAPPPENSADADSTESPAHIALEDLQSSDGWDSGQPDDDEQLLRCNFCDADIPRFALVAHQQFHEFTT